MRMLIRRAYSMKSDQIGGPHWIDEQHYDIAANVPPGVDDEQVRRMLQSLLTERFQLRFHREKRTTSVYALSIAEGGSRLQPPDGPQQSEVLKEAGEEHRRGMARLAARRPGQQRLHLSNSTIAELIDFLSIDIDRPIVDRTKLQGKFAFNLSYSRGVPGQDFLSGPSIFEGLKTQLGLELLPVKGEAERLIIDQGSRMPIGN